MRLRKISPWCISSVGAGLYVLWMTVLAKAGGPNWVMIPSDLVYTYLFNGLNILTGHPPGTLIHPAILVSFFFALCTWVIHGVVGSGELVRDVIQNAEFYMRSVNLIIVALNTIAMFALGQKVYTGTHNRSLILVAQGSFILCPAVSLAYDSFGSPESFQTLFLMLLAGVTIATLEKGLPDQRSRRGYAAIAALITGAAISTKFTSIPMLLLPFLAIPTIRWKAGFLGLAAVSTVLFIAPIFLFPGTWQQVFVDMQGLAHMAAIEREAAGAGSLLGGLSTQARGLFGAMRVFSVILGVEMICCLLLAALASLKRTVLTNAYRIYCAFVLTAVAMVCFVLIRPKPNYFGPYTVVVGIGLVLLAYMAGRYLYVPNKKWRALRHIPNVTAGAIMVLYLAVGRHELTDNRQGVPLLVQMRDDAFKINRMIFPMPEDHALITAIPASNLYSAFDHANEYSHFVHAGPTAAITPRNRYNYPLDDGSSVVDRYSHRVLLRNLKMEYKHLYYWSSPVNFHKYQMVDQWRAPPDAILRNLFVGSAEMLAEVEAVIIPNPYDPNRSVDENASLGWSDGQCATGCRSVQISFDDLRAAIITHYELRAADLQMAQSMPLQWRVEASMDGLRWEPLATVRDDKSWSVGEARTYRLDNTRPYRAYRFIEIETHAGPSRKWPSYVKLYSAGSSVRRLVPLTESFVPRNAFFLDMVKVGFWEQTGGFPRELMAVSDGPRPVREYVLGTGDDGIDSTGRMPKKWTLYGSSDGHQWQELDRREDPAEWKPNERRVYPLSRPGIYRYFLMRIETGFHPSIVRIYNLVLAGRDESTVALEELSALGGPLREKTGPFPMGVQFDFPTATNAIGYTLLAGPYGADSTTRMPTEWRLLGSRDGRSWTSIDVRIGQGGWRNMEERIFRISHAAEYSHYRFIFLAANSPILRIESIEFLGPKVLSASAAHASSR